MMARMLLRWMCLLYGVFGFKVYFIGYLMYKTKKHTLMSRYVFVYI